MNNKEERRIFSEKFKQQIFQLYNASKPKAERINQIADEIFRSWEWNYGKSPN